MNAEGMYFAGLTGASAEEVGEKKTETLRLKFNVTHINNNGDVQSLAEPVQATVDLWMSQGAWPYTVAKLEKLGFNGNFAAPEFGDQVYQDGVWLVCKHEEYQQKMQEKWDLYTASGASPLPTDRAEALAARYRAAVKPTSTAPPPPAAAAAPRAPAAPTTPTTPTPKGPVDADGNPIPF